MVLEVPVETSFYSPVMLYLVLLLVQRLYLVGIPISGLHREVLYHFLEVIPTVATADQF